MGYINKIQIDTNTAHLIEPTLYASSTLSNNAYSASLTDFELVSGATVQIKFSTTNPNASPTLNVNSTGAKTIYYNNAGVGKQIIKANHIYTLIYDSTLNSNAGGWIVAGDFDTNTQSDYGNITTAGKIGSGNNLVVTDSGTVKAGATITSAINTQNQETKFLREDGTWTVPAYTTSADITLNTASVAVVTDANNKLSTENLSVTDSDASTSATTTFVQAVTQSATGKITVTKASLDTSGDWTGTAATATSLASAPSLAAGTDDTNKITVTAGGQTSSEFTIPYATTAAKLTNTSISSTSALNKLSGTLSFAGSGGPWSGYDWVGLQVGSNNDKFQIVGTINSDALLYRNNDNGGTNTSWGSWQIIAHAVTGNAVGGDTQPVYMTSSGVITAGTALGTMAYETATNYALLDSPEFTGTPKSVTPSSDSDDAMIATKAYVDGILAANNAMTFKGTLGTGGTITTVPNGTSGNEYLIGDTYKVITEGTYAGIVCEVGDLLIAIANSTSGQTEVTDAHWTSVQVNDDGLVTSSSTSSTDNYIVRYDGDTGKIIQKSGVTIDDSNNITVPGAIYFGSITNDQSKGIFIYSSSANKHGIWYHNASVDKMMFSASGNADSITGADFCINAHGDGTLATRNNRIPHTGNNTGSVGGANGPVYVDGGQIKACTTYANATVAAAGKATNDSDGNAINSTYFKLTETRAATTSNTFNITNETVSSSTTTGALQVKGGVGIAKKLYVGTGIYVTNTSADNHLSFSRTGGHNSPSYINVPTSSSLAFSVGGYGGSQIVAMIDPEGIVPYTTNTKSIGTSTYKWSAIYATTYYGALESRAETNDLARHVWFAYSTNGSTEDEGVLGKDDDFKYNPSTNVLTTGILTITGGTSSSAASSISSTGTLTVSTMTTALTISTTNGALEAKSTGSGTVKLTSNSGEMILSTTSGNMSLSSGGTVSIGSGNGQTTTISSGSTLYLQRTSTASIIFCGGGTATANYHGRLNASGNLALETGSDNAGTQSSHKLYVKGDSAFEGKIAFGTAASNAITTQAYMQYNSTDLSIDFIFA